MNISFIFSIGMSIDYPVPYKRNVIGNKESRVTYTGK